MTEELREFDDSIGRCLHCGNLIFKSDDDWTASSADWHNLVHKKCDSEYMARASQI